MKIIINRKGESQTPKVTINTKDCHYPYAIRDAIETALELDGHDEDSIKEIFGIMPDTVNECEEKEEVEPEKTPSKLPISELIKQLNEALKDPEYRNAWIANIAMTQTINERWYRESNDKVGKYLNYEDRRKIANIAAEQFIKSLSL